MDGSSSSRCHQPTKFGGHRHWGSGDMFLISQVTSGDQVFKGSCDIIGGSSLVKLTSLLYLVASGITVVDI